MKKSERALDAEEEKEDEEKGKLRIGQGSYIHVEEKDYTCTREKERDY